MLDMILFLLVLSHDDTISGLATDILLMVNSECYDSHEMESREAQQKFGNLHGCFLFINFILFCKSQSRRLYLLPETSLFWSVKVDKFPNSFRWSAVSSAYIYLLLKVLCCRSESWCWLSGLRWLWPHSDHLRLHLHCDNIITLYFDYSAVWIKY